VIFYFAKCNVHFEFPTMHYQNYKYNIMFIGAF
jgi:hypothetical protein